jgi:glycerophosphoryl diester phosphodiesterase
VAERRVNAAESQASTPSCFVEADFMLTADGHLVAAHDPELGGDCGDVSQRTLAELRRCRLDGDQRIASLDDFLAVPLTEWYVDLKSNLLATTDDEIRRSVEPAVAAVLRQRRRRGAVLMLYQVTAEVVDLLARNGIRAGMKGYPVDRPAAEALVDAAQAHGMEMACVRISHVDRAMIDYSRARGIWHLTWELRDKTPQEWSTLGRAGLGGLLTSRDRLQLARDALGIRDTS